MQFLVFRRICSDGRGASARIAIVSLEAGSVALAREAREPDAGCSPCAPAMKAHRHAREGDAEDLADLLEVGIDRSVPVVIESALPIPVPCPLLPCLRQFREAVDGRLDNLGHDNLLKRKRPGAVAGPEWCVRWVRRRPALPPSAGAARRRGRKRSTWSRSHRR